MPSDRRRKRRIREADAIFEECRERAATVGLDLGRHDVGQFSLEWPVTRARWELYPSTQRIYINEDRKFATPMLHMPPGAWTLKAIVEKAIEVLQLTPTVSEVIEHKEIAYHTRVVPKKIIDNGDGTYTALLPAPKTAGYHLYEVDLSFADVEEREPQDMSPCSVAFALERAVAAVQLLADHYFTTADTIGPGQLCNACMKSKACGPGSGREPCPAFIAAEERFKKFEPVREFIPATKRVSDLPVASFSADEITVSCGDVELEGHECDSIVEIEGRE
jgi:hypothetical protein